MGTTFADELQRAVEAGFAGMRAVRAIVAGEVSRETLVTFATQYYAELRTFLDLKLPERLRLCPYDALEVKAFFAHAYVEEQGRFQPGDDHASLFARFCDALGVDALVRERATHRYAQRFHYMRTLEPSREAMVRELAIAFAWESAAPALGASLVAALRQHYDLPPQSLCFFELHEDVDREHSAEALRILLAAADTQDLQCIALASVQEALDLDRYLLDE